MPISATWLDLRAVACIAPTARLGRKAPGADPADWGFGRSSLGNSLFYACAPLSHLWQSPLATCRHVGQLSVRAVVRYCRRPRAVCNAVDCMLVQNDGGAVSQGRHAAPPATLVRMGWTRCGRKSRSCSGLQRNRIEVHAGDVGCSRLLLEPKERALASRRHWRAASHSLARKGKEREDRQQACMRALPFLSSALAGSTDSALGPWQNLRGLGRGV
ncbi:hypothetical protein L1887_61075 [Cichorium endivia]|nr:hypothetical protein L1887_61075 [Cichorium endivia]